MNKEIIQPSTIGENNEEIQLFPEKRKEKLRTFLTTKMKRIKEKRELKRKRRIENAFAYGQMLNDQLNDPMNSRESVKMNSFWFW